MTGRRKSGKKQPWCGQVLSNQHVLRLRPDAYLSGWVGPNQGGKLTCCQTQRIPAKPTRLRLRNRPEFRSSRGCEVTSKPTGKRFENKVRKIVRKKKQECDVRWRMGCFGTLKCPGMETSHTAQGMLRHELGNVVSDQRRGITLSHGHKIH